MYAITVIYYECPSVHESYQKKWDHRDTKPRFFFFFLFRFMQQLNLSLPTTHLGWQYSEVEIPRCPYRFAIPIDAGHHYLTPLKGFGELAIHQARVYPSCFPRTVGNQSDLQRWPLLSFLQAERMWMEKQRCFSQSQSLWRTLIDVVAKWYK